jgi:hypothetical protein
VRSISTQPWRTPRGPIIESLHCRSTTVRLCPDGQLTSRMRCAAHSPSILATRTSAELSPSSMAGYTCRLAVTSGIAAITMDGSLGSFCKTHARSSAGRHAHGVVAPGRPRASAPLVALSLSRPENTFGASNWGDGEGVFRLSPDLRRSDGKRDYFAPPDWRALDERDLDLGGTAPLPLTVGNQPLVLALGKDGRAYLLDRNNLGGIGGSLAAQTISRLPLRTAPAVYSMNGAAYVALQGPGVSCPAPQSEYQLTVLKVAAPERPNITQAWCGRVSGAGSPIVTTTDDGSDPIVWMVGAEGDNRLHGFKGDTGEQIVATWLAYAISKR